MRSDWNREATIGELLSDPMMEAVLKYARITADEVRALMREAAAHRGKVGTDENSEMPSSHPDLEFTPARTHSLPVY